MRGHNVCVHGKKMEKLSKNYLCYPFFTGYLERWAQLFKTNDVVS